MESEKLFTVTKGAKELNVSRGTAWRMIKKGFWPAYKFGPKSTRINVEEIKQLARMSDGSKN